MRLFLACLALLACLASALWPAASGRRLARRDGRSQYRRHALRLRAGLCPRRGHGRRRLPGPPRLRRGDSGLLAAAAAGKALSPKALTERARDNVYHCVVQGRRRRSGGSSDAALRRFWSRNGRRSGGLVMRRFEQGSPYDLEQLYVAPPTGEISSPLPEAGERRPGVRGVVLFCVSRRRTRRGVALPAGAAGKLEALNEGTRAFSAAFALSTPASDVSRSRR